VQRWEGFSESLTFAQSLEGKQHIVFSEMTELT
jgi:hypothetical protein